jgi:hypothetical protein
MGTVFGKTFKKIMNIKPVQPKTHGIIDYVFSGVQMAAPTALHLNSKTTKTYQALGAGFLAINALTDTAVGLNRLLSFKQHQKLDLGFLTGLSLLGFSKFIRKDKKALAFHLGFLTLAVAHYVLTDYKSRK